MLLRNNLLKLLEHYNIQFATSGKNIGRKVLCGIDCPFCGDDDGKHLGIFANGFYTCWRNPEHKGNIIWLLSHLLDISTQEVLLLINDYELYDDIPENYSFDNTTNQKELLLPNLFIEIKKDKPSTAMFYNYLTARGFDDVEYLCSRYNILCCISGEWKNRIIFPVYYKNKLVSWVGRTISNNNQLRYKNLSSELSVMKTTDCLYNYDYIRTGGDLLVITEGIFDALKVDFYTDKSVKATCVFTSRVSENQIKLLSTIDTKFNEILVIFDSDAYVKSLIVAEELSFLKTPVFVKTLPSGKKDFGEFSRYDVLDFFKNL